VRPDLSRTAIPHRRLPPEVLSNEEVCALMDACGRYTPLAIRHRALIAMLYRTGLRINEALALYPKDLDLIGGSVRVLFGKGAKARTVGIDAGATTIIKQWLEVRTKWMSRAGTCHPTRGHSSILAEGFGRCPLFCTRTGHPMTDAYVRRLLKRLAGRAGIDKRVHAHGLRHTHAAQLRAEGIDIGIISKQLGHSSISTTARYLDHLAPRAVIETMRNRTWGAV